jgi:hypothetical protein
MPASKTNSWELIRNLSSSCDQKFVFAEKAQTGRPY